MGSDFIKAIARSVRDGLLFVIVAFTILFVFKEFVCGDEVHSGDEAAFLATIGSAGPAVDWTIHPDAVLTGFTVSGRLGDTFTFLPGASVVGNVQAEDDWGDARGVINVLDSNVIFTDLDVTNNHVYTVDSNHQHQVATALNIKRSVVDVTGSLTGTGKGVLWINSGSDVSFEGEVDSYYFGVGVIGSDFTAVDSTFNQEFAAQAGDKHSAMWIGNAMTDGGIDYHGAIVDITDSLFDMETGTAIVSGNGNNITPRAYVTLTDVEIDWQSNLGVRPVGIGDLHQNYFGWTIDLIGDYDATVDVSGPLPNHDYGWFVDSRGAPGPLLAPVAVCFDGIDCISFPEGSVVAVTEPTGWILGVFLVLGFLGFRRN